MMRNTCQYGWQGVNVMTKQSVKMRAVQSDHFIDTGRRDLQILGRVKQLEGSGMQASPLNAIASVLDIRLSGVTLSASWSLGG